MGMPWVVALVLLGSPVVQEATPASPWDPIRFMVGEWRGTAEGQAGKGTVERSYRFVLRDKYLHERNVSTYPPQRVNEKGEIHEHWSFFSYDRARRAIVLRQFHTEGFVNQFAMAAPAKPGTVVFESETLENAPAGWNARETYDVISPDEFVETFELATGRGGYEVYSRTRFKRVRREKPERPSLRPRGVRGSPRPPRA